ADTIVAGPNDIVYAGDGNDTLIGAIGATLHAGSGIQTLYGAPGGTMFAGKGPNTFVFEPGFGQDSVIDFDVRNDAIAFDSALVGDIGSVMAHTGQVGADTIITFDPQNSVTLKNIQMSTLTASNFHFGSAG